MSKLDELGVNKMNEKEDYVLSGRFIKNLIAEARLEEREALKEAVLKMFGEYGTMNIPHGTARNLIIDYLEGRLSTLTNEK